MLRAIERVCLAACQLRRRLAQAVERDAGDVAGAEEAEDHWSELDAADAIIFGAPTLMGSVSAGMKRFMETVVERYFQQRWNGKLAAGFTTYNPLRNKLLDTYKQVGTVIEAFRLNQEIVRRHYPLGFLVEPPGFVTRTMPPQMTTRTVATRVVQTRRR